MPRLVILKPSSASELSEAMAGVITSRSRAAVEPAIVMRLLDPGEPTERQKESGNYSKRKVAWRGLTISVENEAGDVRRGIGHDGEWATRLPYAYGYVNGSMGVDGDQVDVYLGPDLETSGAVYIVHQRRYGAWDQYDEDKCMLGFLSEDAAREAYLLCYDDPRFLGPITAMPVDTFVDKVLGTKNAPKMLLMKSMVAPYVRDGRAVKGYENGRQRRPKKPGKVDLFATAAGADPFHEKLEALKARTVRYASGLSMERDFVAAAHAGHGVGVEAGELTVPAMKRLAQAVVDWKVPVFIDSGQFGKFMAGVRAGGAPQSVDFKDVFATYDMFAQGVAELNDAEELLPAPLLVMPDIVDDQIGSLNLIAHHRDYVRSTMDFLGVARAIIPIQRGPLKMAEAYRDLVRILGSDEFIVGIPSNAAAITPEEFTEFLADAKPRGVHILGAFADSRIAPRLAQIVASGHEPEWVSSDGNPLRSIIIERGQSAAERAEKLRDRLGESHRQAELDDWIGANGGIEDVREAFAAAAPERQARILGLFMDLSGRDPESIMRLYGLGETLAKADQLHLFEKLVQVKGSKGGKPYVAIRHVKPPEPKAPDLFEAKPRADYAARLAKPGPTFVLPKRETSDAKRELMVSTSIPPMAPGPDLASYDKVLVGFSGGKDSVAAVLALLDAGVPKDKIELHHHDIDGEPGANLMDWPITRAYCKAFADAMGLPIYYSWREGGFEREMLRNGDRTAPVAFEQPDGTLGRAGGIRGKEGTRLKFPQVSADLNVRWCSGKMKIDVMDVLIANQERFNGKRILVVTGERAEESSNRAKYKTFEPHRTHAKTKRHADAYRPVHAWKEGDVWGIMQKHGIVAHPSYRLGYGRLSCRECIFGSDNQWATNQALFPAATNKVGDYENQFGVTIHRTLTVGERAKRGTPYAAAVAQPGLARFADQHEWDASQPIVVKPSEWKLPAGAFGETSGPS